MDTEQILGRLERGVALEGDDAAIRVTTRYEPQAGRQAKVFPPTYLPSNGSKYHFEKRWDDDGEEVDVVVVDAIQSQANRAETALARVAEEAGLPQLLLETELPERTIRISSLEAPHRSRDAYFIDAEVDGVPFDQTEVGQALNDVNANDATAALRYAPYDLIYGVWDSHRGKRMAVRFPRVYTSEMLGWHVLRGKRAAAKSDPLNLPGESGVSLREWRPETTTKQKKKDTVELNTLGHGMIPSEPDEAAGGVAVRTIERQAVLSLTGLASLRFPTPDGDANVAGRAALAAMALFADRLAFAGAGLNLRSGADLLRLSDELEWVRAGGRTEPLDLGTDGAQELLSLAASRLAQAGVHWSGDPFVVAPTQRLREIIEQTFYVPELEPEA